MVEKQTSFTDKWTVPDILEQEDQVFIVQKHLGFWSILKADYVRFTLLLVWYNQWSLFHMILKSMMNLPPRKHPTHTLFFVL